MRFLLFVIISGKPQYIVNERMMQVDQRRISSGNLTSWYTSPVCTVWYAWLLGVSHTNASEIIGPITLDGVSLPPQHHAIN